MEKEILPWLLLSLLQGWFMCWCGKRIQGLECQFDTCTSPRPASLCADSEGFRETPPLKAHFLFCICAQHDLGLRNSALDSLHRGAALITWLRPLCHTTVWTHKVLRCCLGWSPAQLWDAGVPVLIKLYLRTTNNGHSKKVWRERNKLASNYLQRNATWILIGINGNYCVRKKQLKIKSIKGNALKEGQWYLI